MKTDDFTSWLIHIKQMQENAARSRVSNCNRIEKYYNDLDDYFLNDQFSFLLSQFEYTRDDELNNKTTLHKIPINGNLRTGTATLKAALNLYLEFKKDPSGISLPKIKPFKSKSKNLNINYSKKIIDNATGISYKILFGDYLNKATRFEIEDPYIQQTHQLRNFMEFCSLVEKIKQSDEIVSIHLTTKKSLNHHDKNIELFKQIKESLYKHGIDFTIDFSDSIHDRSIKMDNGFLIILGRGLDIWKSTHWISDLASFDQEKRHCKEFDITIINQY
jgi:hypothetical protein